MKTVIKLLLIDLLIAQIIAPLLIAMPCALYQLLTAGTVDQAGLIEAIMIPAQLTGQILMTIYLWKTGYISKLRETWSHVSAPYLLLCVVAVLSAAIVVSAITDQLKWIPDIMEQSFDILQSGWGGILAITLVGPIFEELLFRGAITKTLLAHYSPTKAILLSALLFGIFHLNPAQMLPAFLVGILLAWSYYKTKSLIPCILMHIVNNSLSLYLTSKFPEAKYMDELISGAAYLTTVVLSLTLLLTTILLMNRKSD